METIEAIEAFETIEAIETVEAQNFRKRDTQAALA
jgi:hypothetical protein